MAADQQQREQQDPTTTTSANNNNGMSTSDETTALVASSSTNNDFDTNILNNNILNYARRLIYISHCFSQFSEISWQFGLVLFLAAFTRYKSMILVSTYGMLSWMSVCLFGATTGRFVDGTNRLIAARRFIWCENLSVVIATILCYQLLQHQGHDNNPESDSIDTSTFDVNNNNKTSSSSPWLYGVPTDRHSLLLLLGIHFFGPLAMLLDKGFLVSIERDWVVVMSEQAIKIATTTTNKAVPSPPPDTATPSSNTAKNAATAGATAAAVQAEWLSTTNVVMKQIDLTCQIIAPSVVGFVIAAFDHNNYNNNNNNTTTTTPTVINHTGGSSNASTDLTGAVLLVGLVNIAALIVEYICTARVYHLIPAMAIKPERDDDVTSPRLSLSPTQSSRRHSGTNDLEGNNNGSPSTGGDLLNGKDDPDDKPFPRGKVRNKDADTGCGMGRQIVRYCCGASRHRHRRQRNILATWHDFRRQFLPDGLRVYFKQPIAWGGVGLSLLYLNCLTFGGLMTAYLVWKGMRFQTIGIWRGISSALGLSGTLAYHASVRKTTLVNTGMWSIILEFACLSLCFASFLVQDYSISVAMLITGVVFSRVGLWVFDITIAQLMQEFIPENVRGVVGGTQQSINAFFMLGSFALGLIFPDPRDFWIYALAGYVAIALAMLFYFFGVFLHASRFMTMAEKTYKNPTEVAT